MASRRPTHNFVTSPSGLLYPEVTDDAVNDRTDITFDIAPSTADGWVLTTEGGVVGWAPPSGGGGGGGGVDSIEADGEGALTGDVTLSEGSGITLTTSGNDIEIAASGGGVTVLGYQTFTSTVSQTATTAASGNTVVSASSVVIPGSTLICVEFYASHVQPVAAGDLRLALWQDSTNLGTLGYVYGSGTGGCPVYVRRYFTPSAGTYTYTIKCWGGATGGSIIAGAGGVGINMPGYIRITSGG